MRLVSKGREFDFDVCARLENYTTTPTAFFPKLFPKISKPVDSTGACHCLKCHPGQNMIFDQFFSKNQPFLIFFH